MPSPNPITIDTLFTEVSARSSNDIWAVGSYSWYRLIARLSNIGTEYSGALCPALIPTQVLEKWSYGSDHYLAERCVGCGYLCGPETISNDLDRALGWTSMEYCAQS